MKYSKHVYYRINLILNEHRAEQSCREIKSADTVLVPAGPDELCTHQ